MAFFSKRVEQPADLNNVSEAVAELKRQWVAFQKARKNLDRVVAGARVSIDGHRSRILSDSIYDLTDRYEIKITFEV